VGASRVEDVDGGDSGPDEDAGATWIEPRWPMALAIFTFIAMPVVLRLAVPRQSLGPHWVVPAVEVALLVVLLAASPEDVRSELAPPGRRPCYVDYFVLGFTTSTAFSPTDVMPTAPWAKLTMATPSPISLTVVGLVIARAVNVFSCASCGPEDTRLRRSELLATVVLAVAAVATAWST
jgi:hypothetical protein